MSRLAGAGWKPNRPFYSIIGMLHQVRVRIALALARAAAVAACAIACGLSTRISSKDGLTHRVTIELGACGELPSVSVYTSIARLWLLHLLFLEPVASRNTCVWLRTPCLQRAAFSRCASNRLRQSNSCRRALSLSVDHAPAARSCRAARAAMRGRRRARGRRVKGLPGGLVRHRARHADAHDGRVHVQDGLRGERLPPRAGLHLVLVRELPFL